MTLLEKKHHLIYRHFVLILIITVITSGLGIYFTMKLPLQSDLAELLPDSFASVQALNRIRSEVGGVGNLRIILESKNYHALTSLAEELDSRLTDNPLVKYIDYRNDVAFYKQNALLFLSVVELDSLQDAIQSQVDSEKQKLNPLMIDDLFAENEDEDLSSENNLADWEKKYQTLEPKEYYTNSDSTVLVLRIYPSEVNTSLSFVEKMFTQVRAQVQSANPSSFADDMRVYYGGNFKNRLDEYEVVKNDIVGTALYGLSGVFLLIVFYFRRLSAAILISLTLFCSLSWTFGLAYFVIGSLNTITGFLFVILFGLGIDYGIHAFARYRESRKAGLSFEESMEKMICQTGKALATTAITTSAAFFSLMLMDFKGFSELGFITGVGMLFALVSMTVVLPAFITLFEKFGLLKIKASTVQKEGTLNKGFPLSTPILIVSFLLTLFAFYSVFQVEFEYDFTNLRAITKERELVGEKTKGVFKLGESPAIVLADTKDEIDEIFDALKFIIETDTITPTVKNIRSIYSLVPVDQLDRLAKIRGIRKLVDDEADGLVKGEDKRRLDKLKEYLKVDQPFTWDEFPEKDKRQFINKKGEVGNFVFVYPGVALKDGKNAIDFRDDIGEFKTSSGKVYHASSSNIIMAEMLTIMIGEGKLAVSIAFLVVFIIVYFDFRSLKGTILVLLPLALGVLWMVFVMFVLDLKWNLFNIVVLPSVIGIGVDNGVHIYHRYIEEGPGSMMHVLRNTGLAITMTTLTTIIGYSGLILASHPGLNSIGNLAVIGILSTYIAAMVALPSALHLLEIRKKSRLADIQETTE